MKHVFQLFSDAGLTLSYAKSAIARSRIEYLGHIVDKNGISPRLSKVAAIADMKPPHNQRGIRRFLGAANFFKKHVQNFSGIARPLYDLTKKGIKYQWTDYANIAFDSIKTKLTTAPVLKHIEYDKRLVLSTDASKVAIGACLSQYDDHNDLKPVFYIGRALSKAEKNYTATQLELLAIVWSILELKYYLEFQSFDLVSDHMALKYLTTSKDLRKSQLERYILAIQHFKFTFHHEQGRRHLVPDMLSRLNYDFTRTAADTHLENFPDFPDINQVRLPQECRGIPDHQACHAPENEIDMLRDKALKAQQRRHNRYKDHLQPDDEQQAVQFHRRALNPMYKVPKPRPNAPLRWSTRQQQQPQPCYKCLVDIPHTACDCKPPHEVNVPTKPTTRVPTQPSKQPDTNRPRPQSPTTQPDQQPDQQATEDKPPNEPVETRKKKPDTTIDKHKRNKLQKERRRRTFELAKQQMDHMTPLENLQLPIPPDELSAKQMQDPYCHMIYQFLKKRILPTSDIQARRLLLRENDFLYIGDLLYHVFTPTGKYNSTAKVQIVLHIASGKQLYKCIMTHHWQVIKVP